MPVTTPERMKRSVRRDLTSGSILGSLLRLAIPIVGANLLQTAYQLIDTFWVGRLGADAVAAVSLSFPLMFLLLAVGSGIAVAGTVLVAQYQGMGDHAMVDHFAAQALVMVLLVSLPLTLVGYLAAPWLMQLLGARGAVRPAAIIYLRVSFLGLAFLFAYLSFQSLMRGVGEVKVPFVIVFTTVILNLVLDPLFILGWGPVPALGVTGAAVSTIATQGLAAVTGLALLFSGRFGPHLRWQALTPRAADVWRLLRLGAPASVEQSTRALGLVIMTWLAAHFGTVTIAAYGIGMRIVSFVIIPALGLSMATSTLVGQNLGAGKQGRAITVAKQSAWLAFGLLTVVGVIIFVFASSLVAAFIPDAARAIAQGTVFVRVVALTFGLLGVQQVLAGTFRGAGNTAAAMALALLSLWLLRFPLALVLSRYTGLAELGLWLAFPLSNIIGVLAAMAWLKSGRWLAGHETAALRR